MSRLTLILALYAALATYPAYLQSVRTINAFLDAWAAERVANTLPAATLAAIMEAE